MCNARSMSDIVSPFPPFCVATYPCSHASSVNPSTFWIRRQRYGPLPFVLLMFSRLWTELCTGRTSLRIQIIVQNFPACHPRDSVALLVLLRFECLLLRRSNRLAGVIYFIDMHAPSLLFTVIYNFFSQFKYRRFTLRFECARSLVLWWPRQNVWIVSF